MAQQVKLLLTNLSTQVRAPCPLGSRKRTNSCKLSFGNFHFGTVAHALRSPAPRRSKKIMNE